MAIGAAVWAAPLAANLERIDGALEDGDRTRRVSVLGSMVDSPYDCHAVRVGAGEGIRISASATGPNRESWHRLWARIGSADCSQVMSGVADQFASRSPTTVGILVTTESHGAVRIPYRLSIERFDAAARERDRNAAAAAYEQGRTKLEARDFAGAVAAFERAVGAAPQDQASLAGLGLAQAGSGDLAAATASFSRVLASEGDNSEIERLAIRELNNVGDALLRRRDAAGAEAAFDAVRRFDRDDVAATLGLAVARILQEKPADLGQLSARLPLDRVVMDLRQANAEIIEREAVANGQADRAETARQAKARARADMESMPMILETVSLNHEDGKLTLSGTLIGKAATPGSRYTLWFELGGYRLATEPMQVTVTAPAQGETATFSVEQSRSPGLNVRRYSVTPCTSC